eukprot:g2299.t1
MRMARPLSAKRMTYALVEQSFRETERKEAELDRKFRLRAEYEPPPTSIKGQASWGVSKQRYKKKVERPSTATVRKKGNPTVGAAANAISYSRENKSQFQSKLHRRRPTTAPLRRRESDIAKSKNTQRRIAWLAEETSGKTFLTSDDTTADDLFSAAQREVVKRQQLTPFLSSSSRVNKRAGRKKKVRPASAIPRRIPYYNNSLIFSQKIPPKRKKYGRSSNQQEDVNDRKTNQNEAVNGPVELLNDDLAKFTIGLPDRANTSTAYKWGRQKKAQPEIFCNLAKNNETNKVKKKQKKQKNGFTTKLLGSHMASTKKNTVQFYHVCVQLQYPGSLAKWRFSVTVTDTTDQRFPSKLYSFLRATTNGKLIFREDEVGNKHGSSSIGSGIGFGRGLAISPAEDFPWIKSTSEVYGRTFRVEVKSVYPTHLTLLDRCISFGSVPKATKPVSSAKGGNLNFAAARTVEAISKDKNKPEKKRVAYMSRRQMKSKKRIVEFGSKTKPNQDFSMSVKVRVSKLERKKRIRRVIVRKKVISVPHYESSVLPANLGVQSNPIVPRKANGKNKGDQSNIKSPFADCPVDVVPLEKIKKGVKQNKTEVEEIPAVEGRKKTIQYIPATIQSTRVALREEQSKFDSNRSSVSGWIRGSQRSEHSANELLKEKLENKLEEERIAAEEEVKMKLAEERRKRYEEQ